MCSVTGLILVQKKLHFAQLTLRTALFFWYLQLENGVDERTASFGSLRLGINNCLSVSRLWYRKRILKLIRFNS
jgi:hypothetical protein